MKKKKIVFLIHTLGGGGAEKVLVNLVNNMDKDKYDITVMTVIDTGIYRAYLNSNIKYKSMFKIPKIARSSSKIDKSGSLLNKKSSKKKALIRLYTSFWKIAPLKLLHNLYIGNKYDIEVAFLEGISAKIIANSSNKNSKKIAWIHVDLLNQHKSKKVFKNKEEERNTYSKFDQIVCVSEKVKESFDKLFSFDANNKVIVKHNVIDSNEIIRKSKVKTDISSNDFTICSIGRLNRQKNYLRLAKCAYLLRKKKLHFNVWIIGEGTGRERIQKYIDTHQMNDYFHLLGFRKNPYSILKKADLFVCSSIAEGYSTSVVEALILKKPVVTTDCAGMKEIFGNSHCGIIVPNNTNSLFNGLYRVMTTSKLYRIIKQGAETKSKDFNLQQSVKNIETIL